MPHLRGVLVALAGCAVFAAAVLGNAGHASALDADEALREVFRETSRAAGPEEKLRQLGAVRPTLGYSRVHYRAIHSNASRWVKGPVTRSSSAR